MAPLIRRLERFGLYSQTIYNFSIREFPLLGREIGYRQIRTRLSNSEAPARRFASDRHLISRQAYSVEHDEFRLSRNDIGGGLPLPLGEGWGEGLRLSQEQRPSPDLLRKSTSPHRGEVNQHPAS
jgi:hypothetical protein